MSILRHSLWAAASGIFVTASRFALTAILARRLSTEVFGQYAYAQWLVDICFLVCAFGATGVASRYFAEYRHQPAKLAAIVRRWRPFSLALPFAGALAAALGAWLSEMPLHAEAYALLLCWGLAAGIWGMHVAALSGLQRFDLVFRSNVLAAATMLIGATLLPLHDGSPLTLLAIMAVANATAALVGVRYITEATRGDVVKLENRLTHEIWRYSLNIWLASLLWSLAWSRGEVPVIRGLLGDDAVARYSVALTLYGGAVAGVMLGVSGIAPQITRFWGEGNQAAAVALCRRAMDLQLLLAGLGALALIWFAPELMQLGFGPRYRDSAMLLGILAVGLPALTLASHNHLMQIITGARYNRDTTLLAVILLMGLTSAGVVAFGVVGGAWARATTLLALGGITLFVSWRRWGSAAIGMLNIGLILTVSVASVLCNSLGIFLSLPFRGVVWATLSMALLALIKDESKLSVVVTLTRLLRNRYMGNRS